MSREKITSTRQNFLIRHGWRKISIPGDRRSRFQDPKNKSMLYLQHEAIKIQVARNEYLT